MPISEFQRAGLYIALPLEIAFRPDIRSLRPLEPEGTPTSLEVDAMVRPQMENIRAFRGKAPGSIQRWRSCFVAAAIGAGALAGCTTEVARLPVPEPDVNLAQASITTNSGLGAIRIWGDEAPVWYDQLVSLPPAKLKELMPGIYGKPHAYLALSGGGENGAYGAGLLNGWTAAGNRPEFTFVTGISAGSLIARRAIDTTVTMTSAWMAMLTRLMPPPTSSCRIMMFSEQRKARVR
jgi:hypothetical protein